MPANPPIPDTLTGDRAMPRARLTDGAVLSSCPNALSWRR